MNRPSFYGDDGSRRSSSSESSGESELLLRSELREQEHRALIELELCKTLPIAFAVRTNIEFDGVLHGLDAPIPNRVVSFKPREFLHIKKRFGQNWWIGRPVRIGAPLGFIPSVAKLESLRSSLQSNLSQLLLAENLASPGGNSSGTPKSPLTPSILTANSANSSSNHVTTSTASGGERNTTGNNEKPAGSSFVHFFGTGRSKPTAANEQATSPGIPTILHEGLDGDPGKKATQGLNPNIPGVAKKKAFFKKGFSGSPYELVPNIRPVVVVGPALKGYEVTDMMQKALFDSLKKAFEGRLIVTRVNHDLSLYKRLNALLNMDKKSLTDRTRGRQLITLLEVQREIERIFDLAAGQQLVVLDCDTINHPNQIAKSCLAPIVVYIKISSIRVLQRLIKNRGQAQKSSTNVQTAASERLLQCLPESFDIILEQNTLDGATEALRDYLEAYWMAVNSSGDLSKAEKILGATPGTHARSQTDPKIFLPMVPGRPGLNIATQPSLAAGFTVTELSALAGDRQAGVLGVGADGGEGGSADMGIETLTNAAGAREGAEEDAAASVAESDQHESEEGAVNGVGGGGKSGTRSRKRPEYEAAVASDRLAGAEPAAGGGGGGIHGILKGAGSHHLSPDKAHALAVAEAAVKNMRGKARVEVPLVTVGLHQSTQAAHSEPGGIPKYYQSRSTLQAKQRQEEIEAARRKAEEAAAKAAEARAATGAQRQERRRQRRLQLEQLQQQQQQQQQQNVKFGGSRVASVDLQGGPVLNRHRTLLSADESQPGSNLRRNTSSVTASPETPRSRLRIAVTENGGNPV
ncbi:hypothetical protein SprV_0200977000 [Sparganum proliferum]